METFDLFFRNPEGKDGGGVAFHIIASPFMEIPVLLFQKLPEIIFLKRLLHIFHRMVGADAPCDKIQAFPGSRLIIFFHVALLLFHYQHNLVTKHSLIGYRISPANHLPQSCKPGKRPQLRDIVL